MSPVYTGETLFLHPFLPLVVLIVILQYFGFRAITQEGFDETCMYDYVP